MYITRGKTGETGVLTASPLSFKMSVHCIYDADLILQNEPLILVYNYVI